MVGSVGSSTTTALDATAYQRKALPPVSTKIDPGSVYKPRLGGFASPEMMATIKEMSAAAKGAQAQYNAFAKQAAEMNSPPSEQLIAMRQYFSLDQFGKFPANATADPLSALVIDTKA